MSDAKKEAGESQNETEIKEALAEIERRRVEEATRRIQEICEEYNVMLQGQIVIPVSNIRVVPRRD